MTPWSFGGGKMMAIVQFRQIDLIRVSRLDWLLDSIYTMARTHSHYGVASISRLLKIIGLFCKRAL